jgi:hypothetical protein
LRLGLSEQQINSNAYYEVQNEPGIQTVETMSCGFGQHGLRGEVNEISKENGEKHSHPVVDHIASYCIIGAWALNEYRLLS